jgi:hypothetical protein
MLTIEDISLEGMEFAWSYAPGVSQGPFVYPNAGRKRITMTRNGRTMSVVAEPGGVEYAKSVLAVHFEEVQT